jgi:hypothetical protein
MSYKDGSEKSYNEEHLEKFDFSLNVWNKSDAASENRFVTTDFLLARFRGSFATPECPSVTRDKESPLHVLRMCSIHAEMAQKILY